MIKFGFSILMSALIAFAQSPSSSQSDWKQIKQGAVTFSAPNNALMKAFIHEEGTVISVFIDGLKSIKLEIKIEAGGCILPMSKLLIDSPDHLGFELKYKIGNSYRNNVLIISKHNLTACSCSYNGATPEQSVILDKIINSIIIDKVLKWDFPLPTK